MKCAFCGGEVQDQAKVCPLCGAVLEGTPVPQPPSPFLDEEEIEQEANFAMWTSGMGTDLFDSDDTDYFDDSAAPTQEAPPVASLSKKGSSQIHRRRVSEPVTPMEPFTRLRKSVLETTDPQEVEDDFQMEDAPGGEESLEDPEPRQPLFRSPKEEAARRKRHEERLVRKAATLPDTGKKGLGLNQLYTIALVAALLSFLFSLTSLGFSHGYLFSIAAFLLVVVAYLNIRYDTVVMAGPVILVAIRFLIMDVSNKSRVYIYSDIGKMVHVCIYLTVLWYLLFLGGAILEKKVAVLGLCGVFLMDMVVCLLQLLASLPSHRTRLYHVSMLLFVVTYFVRIYLGEKRYIRLCFAEGVFTPSQEPTYTGDVDGYPHYSHPYHMLGGWLRFLVLAGYISLPLLIAAIIRGTKKVYDSSAHMGGLAGYFKAGMGSTVWAMVLGDICLGLLVILQIWLFELIRRKEKHFLAFFHLMAGVCTFLGFLSVALSRGLLWGLLTLLLAGLGTILLTMYFATSVRVRTYMGSDEYLRADPLTRNLPSPTPADSLPYVPEP